MSAELYANLFSLITDKTKYILFHNVKIRGNHPLLFPDLFIMLKSKERTN